jgi:sec-independent protein translocase protein TatA
VGNLGPTEILIIAGVIILLFGARKLPEMARSLGKSARILRAETKGMKSDEETEDGKDTKPPEQITAAAPAPKAEVDKLKEQLEAAELREQVAKAEARAKAAESETKASVPTDASPIENAQANKNVG